MIISSRANVLSLSILSFFACGGGGQKKPPETPPAPGDVSAKPDAAPPPAPEPPPPPSAPPAPVTFELKNDGDGDLVFALDKGWQPVIFAYTGKPPKAKSILLFPTWCTESCDATPDVICPVCKAPEKKAEEAAETKREVAAKGSSVKVPWDGQMFAYEKAKGDKRKCKCWRKAEPPPGTYTIKACGLRPSSQIGKGSRPQCAEGEMTLPLSGTPTTITLTFAK